ncbi:hypothetical protein [Marinoscillum pacificum]|uniref:hypothetical protein n=1 Tax=Marinoscillum pacificum TaxID=392723 RepID=UPI002157A8D6|nr:hypothetical protein [Marinoscillum pacificum]
MDTGELIFWLTSTLAAAIISVVIAYVFSNAIKDLFAPWIVKFSRSGGKGINGRWIATFDYGDTELTEEIEISTFLGTVYGRVTATPEKSQKPQKVLRLRGEIADNHYFTGIWYHPIKTNRHHGAFQLLIDLNDKELDGQWLGFSKSQGRIRNGEWNWVR